MPPTYHHVKHALHKKVKTNPQKKSELELGAFYLHLLVYPFVNYLFTQMTALAPTYLQPHYGNGVFGNVYLLDLDNTKR